MKHHPCRIGQRVKCGDVESLGTVRAIKGDGYVIAVEYDDQPGELFNVHLYDAVVVSEVAR